MSIIVTGNFDGVHRGHARLLSIPVKIAEERGEKVGVLTFSTITHNTFGKMVKYINDNETKKDLLLSAGADFVKTIDFTPEFYNMSGDEFVTFLKNDLNADMIVCGDDFRFGKGASCGPDDMKLICKRKNIECIVVMTDNISSTAIREQIQKGNISKANRMLGHDFVYRAKQISGNHIGTELGYATINMEIDRKYVLPPEGVYATYCIIDGEHYPSVTNIGKRPTVTNDVEDVIETHILNIDSEKLDNTVCDKIYFLERLRDEHKFLDRDFLKTQISIDCQTSKAIFDLFYAH